MKDIFLDHVFKVCLRRIQHLNKSHVLRALVRHLKIDKFHEKLTHVVILIISLIVLQWLATALTLPVRLIVLQWLGLSLA